MANGTTVNAEQLVKLRKRTSASGNTILFLDYVQFGERVRESIGLTLLPGSTLAIKEKNRLTMSKAQAIRLEKEKQLLHGNRDRTNQGSKTLFLPYYRLLLEDRKASVGNWGAFRHFDAYSAEKVGEDQYSYIWVHFVDFGDDQRVWLMPKTRIKAEGELELQVFKDRVSINCRVEDLSKWVKDESKQ